MKNSVISEYAEALFLLSCEEKSEDAYYGDMLLIKKQLDENPEYVELLCSPAITKEEKADILDAAFSPFLNENIVSFLKLLCERGRIKDFSPCFEDYERLYNDSRKLIVAEVTTASPLSKSEEKRLISTLMQRYGVKVELICKIDKSILGGMIVRTKDSVMDGSLRTKIREIKDVIKA